jgi:hypothetical protein
MGYNLYSFTASNTTIRLQSLARQEGMYKSKYIEDYFRDKYDLKDASEEQFYEFLGNIEENWKILENEMLLSEDNNKD